DAAPTTRVREPPARFGAERANSAGEDFGDPEALAALEAEVRTQARASHAGGPILSGRVPRDVSVPVTSPADTHEVIGVTRDTSAQEIRVAMEEAAAAQPAWDATPAEARAACLTTAADLLEQRRGHLPSPPGRQTRQT